MKRLTLLLTCFILSMGLAIAQVTKINGVVVDEEGEPIAGASVIVKENTAIGTATDIEGRFNLEVPVSAKTLIVKYLGMEDQEKPITSNIRIVMKVSEELLDEIVVLGYGSGQKLGTVVGSVSRVSAAEIKGRPSNNALDALQGKVAGVQIFTSSGEPSATSSIRFHGVGSLGASNTPLYVVDGIPIDAGSFQALNQNDFESITFLKDASSTSIYGARAANGVLYLTTKKGTIGQHAQISFTAQYSASSLADRSFFNGFMNSKQLSDFWVETGYRTQAQVNELLAKYPYDTRWSDYYYKDNVPTVEGVLQISGGSGKTRYFVSGGYYTADGIAYRSDYSRYTLRTNIETQAKNWLKFGINTTLAYSQRNLNGWGSNSVNRGLFFLTQPFYTPNDPETGERYEYIPGANKYHPYYLADKNPVDNNDIQLTGSVFAELSPIKGLTIRSQHNIDGYDQRTSDIRLASYLGNPNNGTRSENFYRNHIYTLTNTAEYKFIADDKHDVAILGGQEYIGNKNQSFSASSAGMTDDRLMLLGSGPSSRSVGQSKTEYAYFSLFGRVNYAFNGKYHANINVREDQSSRFGKDNRSAVFVSGGVMWNIKNENFIKNISAVDELKVRLSYGSAGNSEIGNYNHLATIGTTQYGGQPGWALSSPGNPGLSWEEQNTLSLSVSTRLFDKINFEVEYYDRRTKSMLMSVPYPYTSGFETVTSNVGKLQNKGVDISLDLDVVKLKDLNINVYTAFNYNANKVLELFQGRNQWTVANTGVSYVVGKPVMFYYPVFAGVDPADGKQTWYLPNPNDNSITTTDKNNVTKSFSAATLEQNTGNPRYAPIMGGFGLKASYKGLQLDAFFSYAVDKYLINNDRYFSSNPSNFAGYNQHTEVLDYWKQPGDVTNFPKYGEVLQFDTHLLENASFLRLKALTLSYNIPKHWVSSTRFFSGTRIYVTGRNLFTSTKYTGPDPEVDSNLTYGVYPNTRQYSIGLELKF